MADLSQIPNFQLKVILLIHSLLFSMATTGYWAPTGYIFYNTLVIVLILHVIISENLDSLQIALVMNACSFILDVFIVAMHFRSQYIFAGIIAIIFLLIKPATAYLMFRISREKAQATGPIRDIGDIFVTERTSYEDIDHNVPPPASHPSHGGYNITTAQQI